jgi:hypothetical protein
VLHVVEPKKLPKHASSKKKGGEPSRHLQASYVGKASPVKGPDTNRVYSFTTQVNSGVRTRRSAVLGALDGERPIRLLVPRAAATGQDLAHGGIRRCFKKFEYQRLSTGESNAIPSGRLQSSSRQLVFPLEHGEVENQRGRRRRRRGRGTEGHTWVRVD